MSTHNPQVSTDVVMSRCTPRVAAVCHVLLKHLRQRAQRKIGPLEMLYQYVIHPTFQIAGNVLEPGKLLNPLLLPCYPAEPLNDTQQVHEG